MVYVLAAMFFASPLAALGYFILSLSEYLSCRKRNKMNPGSVDGEVLRTKKDALIVSSVLFGFLTAVVVGFILVTSTAVIYM